MFEFIRKKFNKSIEHRLQPHSARLTAVEDKLNALSTISRKLDLLLENAEKLDAQRELTTRISETVDKTSATVEALSFMLNDNAAVKTLPINDKLMLVKLTFGPSLYMDPRDPILTMAISRVGYWEPENTHFVSSRVRHGINCIDVGANYGYYTALFRGIVGDTAAVLAFEPNPAVYWYLRQTAFTLYMGEYRADPKHYADGLYNFHDDRLGMVYNLALGEKHSTMKLRYPGHVYGGSTLMDLPEIDMDAVYSNSAEVEVVPLDSLDIDSSKPGFWKIDAEGSEYHILKGAAETIRKFEQLDIMLEYEPNMAAAVLNAGDYFGFIDSLGLDIAVIGANATTEPVSPDAAANLPALKYLHLSKRR